MTKFNTGNPVGSADPRDLHDTAQVADSLVHGEGQSYKDRLGKSRKSWAGIEKDFDDFLKNSGYELLGDYAAGIEVTAYNQVIREAGQFWAPAAGTSLPYTTTGAGMDEGGAFVSRGDAVLRQDLADNTPGQGASLVSMEGGGSVESVALKRVDSLAELKSLPTGPKRQASLSGARAGVFAFDSSDLSTEVTNDPQEGAYVAPDSDPTGASGAWVRVIENGEISVLAFGAVQGAASGAENGNTSALNAAHQWSANNGVYIIYDNMEALEVDSTIYIYEGTRIRNKGDGGILRLNKTPDGDGRIDVLSLGVASSFVKDWKIEGGLPVQFSAGITDVNKRGEGTSVINLNNTYDFTLEVKVQYAESALYGKSVFNGKGDVRVLWCYRGWDIDPSRANSAGAACTSLNFYNTFDFTIFPFVLESHVYCNFTGYVQAIRRSYAHHPADDMAVVYSLNGCASCHFDHGIEAVEGMVYRNDTTPNYISMRNRHELGAAAEDHLVRDAARNAIVPYAEQAVYSSNQVGTLLLDDSVFSGSTVVTSTDGASVFFKSQDGLKVQIRGGFFEPGANYTAISGGSLVGFSGEAARFLKDILWADGSETIFPIGSGIVMAQVSGLTTNASGEVVVSAPAGYGRILSATVYLNRSVHSADNVFSIKSKSTNSWTFICGVGAGFGAYAEIICLENS